MRNAPQKARRRGAERKRADFDAQQTRPAAATATDAPRSPADQDDSPATGLALTGTMRLPRSRLLAPLLMIGLTAATWAGSVARWTIGGAGALVSRAAHLHDIDEDAA